jgi:hypothetical protein
MSSKIEESSGMPLIALADFRKLTGFDAYSNYKTIHLRSLLFSWFLDMVIIEQSEGKTDLSEIIATIASNPDLEIQSDLDLIQEIVRRTDSTVEQYFNEYYFQPKSFEYKKLLHSGGYYYANGEDVILYKAGPFELEFVDGKGIILIRKKNPCFGNEERDELIAIDGRLTGRSNIFRLFRRYISRNSSGEKISITVKRSDKELQFDCIPEPKKERVNFYIYPDEKATGIQFKSRQIITGSY